MSYESKSMEGVHFKASSWNRNKLSSARKKQDAKTYQCVEMRVHSDDSSEYIRYIHFIKNIKKHMCSVKHTCFFVSYSFFLKKKRKATTKTCYVKNMCVCVCFFVFFPKRVMSKTRVCLCVYLYVLSIYIPYLLYIYTIKYSI